MELDIVQQATALIDAFDTVALFTKNRNELVRKYDRIRLAMESHNKPVAASEWYGYMGELVTEWST